MQLLNELVIRGPALDLVLLLRRLEESLSNGWNRDVSLEQRLRGTGNGSKNVFCFRCEATADRPAVALWLQARTREEWYVSNIVPLERRELSDDEYYGILREFETDFLEPLVRGSEIRSEIVPQQTRLEDFLSPEACRRLRAFSAAANRCELRPQDRLRWHGFLTQSHREDASLDSPTLEKWLESEGWSSECRHELIGEYEAGRALLAQYDEEQRP